MDRGAVRWALRDKIGIVNRLEGKMRGEKMQNVNVYSHRIERGMVNGEPMTGRRLRHIEQLGSCKGVGGMRSSSNGKVSRYTTIRQ